MSMKDKSRTSNCPSISDPWPSGQFVFQSHVWFLCLFVCLNKNWKCLGADMIIAVNPSSQEEMKGDTGSRANINVTMWLEIEIHASSMCPFHPIPNMLCCLLD